MIQGVVGGQFVQPEASARVLVEGGRHLFVSTGIGTSILPVRFRVPPEISIVTIRSKPLSVSPPRD
ncbi:MAG: hypothetical protein JSR62_02085 [Nitrospira sp.]|nr:hypothetical protein [Nitrospira sp.]